MLHQTPLGPVGIVENGTAITHIFWGHMVRPEQLRWKDTPLLKEAAGQLDEYFRGTRRIFDLPLAPQGTSFEEAVWQALLTIPYGETRSYADIARANGQAVCLPPRRPSQRAQSHKHYYSLPQGHRRQQKTDRVYRRVVHQAIPA